jgi:hypothetical protein
MLAVGVRLRQHPHGSICISCGLHLRFAMAKCSKRHPPHAQAPQPTAAAAAGALNYGNKTVQDVMTKADDVFMLDMATRLSFDTMLEIYKSGFTRIPVYEHSREYIKGILYVKDLILIDPDDEITLEAIITFRCAQLRWNIARRATGWQWLQGKQIAADASVIACARVTHTVRTHASSANISVRACDAQHAHAANASARSHARAAV